MYARLLIVSVVVADTSQCVRRLLTEPWLRCRRYQGRLRVSAKNCEFEADKGEWSKDIEAQK